MKKEDLPKILPVFPLSNFIIFPRTTVPLNIFEPRYIQMIDKSMKSDRMIGMIQPKKTGELKKPDLHDVGCAGKITSFNETDDGRYLIILNGVCRFKILDEVNNINLYIECEVKYEEFSSDLTEKSDEIKFSDLRLIFQNLKGLFKKQGYEINWKEIEKQIIVKGKASKISKKESKKYFESRPRKSKIAAWASKQSSEIKDEKELNSRFLEYEKKFLDDKIPLPDFWGGYIIVPDSIEFWIGRKSRMHDRIIYLKNNDDWVIKKLYP